MATDKDTPDPSLDPRRQFSSGMSVHSLVGNREGSAQSSQQSHPQQGQPQPQPQQQPQSTQPTSASTSTNEPPSSSTSVPSSRFPGAKFPIPPQTPGQPNIDQTGLLALLGPNVTSFPYSENAYVESIRLRSEQEKTKQDYYRLEIANKNFAILQNALRAQIPVNLIPLMCVGDLTEQQQQQLQQSPRVQGQVQVPVPIPVANVPTPGQPYPTGQAHPPGSIPIPIQSDFQKGHSRASSRDFDTPQAGPPMGYRFGGTAGSSAGGPTINPSASRRPLSPAKIGAAAVANLALPTTPYRGVTSNTRRTRHSRHYSMPVESSSRAPTRPEPQQPKPQKTTNVQSGASTPVSASATPTQGSTSTIQVKPVPAQPLHKQSKSTLPPSQESMTSFQHIIQFHHWKPDGPGQQGPNIGPGNPFRTQPQLQPPQHTHKRHKSENVDLSTVQPQIQGVPIPNLSTPNNMGDRARPPNDTIIEDEDDLGMDSTLDEINSANSSKIVPREDPNEPIVDPDSNPPGPGHRRQSSNVGRYPHDILSPYSR